jgi:cytochrome c oxidase subunit II
VASWGEIMSNLHPEMHERRILWTEILWAFGVGVLIAATLSMVIFTALTMGVNPPSNVERIDPKVLHLSGEFAEHNLGTRIERDGTATARVVATQFMFVPRCIAVPQGKRVTLRFTSPDVLHGLLVTGTNVNTMVVPGYVAQVHTEFTKTGDLLMPCHEYCGLGHSEMWAIVQVIPESEMKPDSEGRITCAQR